MIKGVLLVIYVVILGINIGFAQDYNVLVNLENKKFERVVKESKDIDSRDLWNFLNLRVESDLKARNFSAAIETAKKTKFVSDVLRDKIVLGRSLALLGRTEYFGGVFEKSQDYFQQSYQILLKEVNGNPEEQNLIYLAESLYHFGLIYADPDLVSVNNSFAIGIFGKSLSIVASLTNNYGLFVRIALQIARCFGKQNNHIAKLLWLDTARQRLLESSSKDSQLFFDISYESFLVYSRISDYSAVFEEFNKMSLINDVSSKSQIRYFGALAEFNFDLGKIKQAELLYKSGIEIAQKNSDETDKAWIYAAKMLYLLNDGKLIEAKKYLELIEKLKSNNSLSINTLDLSVTKAVIAGFEGDTSKSKEYFDIAEKDLVKNFNNDKPNTYFLRFWQSKVALFQKDYEKLKSISEKYLDVAKKYNSKDSLLLIYINLTKAYLGTGNLSKAKEAINRSIELLETKRDVNHSQISIGVVESSFEAYQLQTDIHLTENKVVEAFQSSENLKGRWLNDKITGNPLNQKVYVDQKLKTEIFDLSVQILKNPKDEKLFAKLSELEKKAIFYENDNKQNNELSKTNNNLLTELENSPIDNQTAVVSYAFSNDGKLNSFVWQKGKSLEVKQLPIAKEDVDKLAEELPKKMKASLYFKKDGQQIYDKLLKPLGLSAKHLIIVPDKSLWKIPFQALRFRAGLSTGHVQVMSPTVRKRTSTVSTASPPWAGVTSVSGTSSPLRRITRRGCA